MRISDWSSDVCSSDLPMAEGIKDRDIKMSLRVSFQTSATILILLYRLMSKPTLVLYDFSHVIFGFPYRFTVTPSRVYVLSSPKEAPLSGSSIFTSDK